MVLSLRVMSLEIRAPEIGAVCSVQTLIMEVKCSGWFQLASFARVEESNRTRTE